MVKNKRLPPSKAMPKETVTYNRRLGKWEVQQRKAGEKMEQTEVPNVKKDDTGRQDLLAVGTVFTGLECEVPKAPAGTQWFPLGSGPGKYIYPNPEVPHPWILKAYNVERILKAPPRQPWWNKKMGLWPPFRQSGFAEWSMRSQGSIPSEWICRCGNDMLWRHRESPPIYETCRPCFDAMRAAGIDNEMWKARVRRERDQLISEQAAAAETAKTGQS